MGKKALKDSLILKYKEQEQLPTDLWDYLDEEQFIYLTLQRDRQKELLLIFYDILKL